MDILLFCVHLFTLLLQAITAFLNFLLKRALDTSRLATALEDSTQALVRENRAMTRALTTLTESQVSLTKAVTQALVNHTRAMVRFNEVSSALL